MKLGRTQWRKGTNNQGGRPQGDIGYSHTVDTPLLRLVLWLVLECFQIIEVKPYFRQLHPAAVRNVAKFSNLGGCRFVSWFRRQVGIFTKKEIPVIISGSAHPILAAEELKTHLIWWYIIPLYTLYTIHHSTALGPCDIMYTLYIIPLGLWR